MKIQTRAKKFLQKSRRWRIVVYMI